MASGLVPATVITVGIWKHSGGRGGFFSLFSLLQQRRSVLFHKVIPDHVTHDHVRVFNSAHML